MSEIARDLLAARAFLIDGVPLPTEPVRVRLVTGEPLAYVPPDQHDQYGARPTMIRDLYPGAAPARTAYRLRTLAEIHAERTPLHAPRPPQHTASPCTHVPQLPEQDVPPQEQLDPDRPPSPRPAGTPDRDPRQGDA